MHGAPLGSAAALWVLDALAQILSALHKTRDPFGAPRIHGSLSGSAVLVDPAGNLTLLGPGLPLLNGLIVPRTGGDCARFWAPELARLEPVDERADVYSLGVLAYELLAGRRYRHSLSQADLIDAAAKNRPPDLPAQLPDPQPDILALLGKALAPHRDARFYSMDAFRSEAARIRARLDVHPGVLAKLLNEFVLPEVERGSRVILGSTELEDPLRIIGMKGAQPSSRAIIPRTLDGEESREPEPPKAPEIDERTREAWNAILQGEEAIDEAARTPIEISNEPAKPAAAAAVTVPAPVRDTMELPAKAEPPPDARVAPEQPSSRGRTLVYVLTFILIVAAALVLILTMDD
jgi:hypothetical protein